MEIRSALLLLFPLGCTAGIGLTGIDSFENRPFCAAACYGSLSSYRLNCSVVHGDEDDHHAEVMTSPECRADHAPFLTSLAWCIQSKCEEVNEVLTTSQIEEFHPFSVIPASLLSPTQPAVQHVPSGGSEEEGSQHQDVEKHRLREVANPPTATSAHTPPGITLLIRKSTGLTKLLQTNDSPLTLIEGPYSNTSLTSILRCDRVLLIGGGIGITGLLPLAGAHPNVRLCWTVRPGAERLVSIVEGALRGVAEKEVQVGARTDIEGVLAAEVEAGWARIGVVACGPAGLCDDVRAAVSRAGRRTGVVFELQIDAYSW